MPKKVVSANYLSAYEILFGQWLRVDPCDYYEEEEDGAPTVPVATIIKVPNSTLTDNADGTASLSFGVITEVDPVASAVNGILKSNGTTLSAAIADTDL